MNRRERWTALANTNLLRHILTQASKGIHYSDAQHNPMTQEAWDLTAPLVDYKNAWIRDMLEYEQEHGKVPEAEGKKQWNECMACAEVEVDNVRRRYAVGIAA